MRRLVFFLLAALPAACIVRADVGDVDGPDASAFDASKHATDGDPPAPNDDAKDGSAKDAHEDDGVSPEDASCGVVLDQQASFIDVEVVGGPSPFLNGGAVASGMYELVAMRAYGSFETGTMQVRETMRVRGSSTNGAFDRWTEAKNATGSFKAYPPHGEIITWETSVTGFYYETKDCPKASGERSGSFEATTDTLTLYDNQTWIARTYKRLP